ncbi:hypothetical protein D0T51_07790 [Parabacteroides sp. 52]|nr:hypothetical protein [Parabacteroides sp. 52]
MLMKNIHHGLIAILVCLFTNSLYAQESSIFEKLIRQYQQQVGEHALPFNGKEQSSYNLYLTNDPYWCTKQFESGDLWYNNTLYKGIPMRLDLYRDELIVRIPDKPFSIVLESEKCGGAFLHGYFILPSLSGTLKQAPAGNYHILLHEGDLPIIKSYNTVLGEKIADQRVEYTFRFSEKIYVNKDNVCYQITNKSSLLRLFADKKKELEAYIKQNKLKFNKSQREKTIVMVVEYYETLMK